ncbi:hypothetical protein PCAR4_650009 [Paraburkholderia caribensis]|nr:hypothetical protein PCAR4_650009 [Paraburkholderia caribensis]
MLRNILGDKAALAKLSYAFRNSVLQRQCDATGVFRSRVSISRCARTRLPRLSGKAQSGHYPACALLETV